MKTVSLFILMTCSHLAFGSPLAEMEIRQETHKLTSNLDCSDGKKSDLGLLTTISCQISCFNKALKTYSVEESFIPESLGLEPGNGSNNQGTIIWGSLNNALRGWSNEKCLEKAQSVCGKDSNIQEVGLDSLTSGEWSIKKFPGCHEKEITISPFDDSVKSQRIESVMKKIVGFDAFPPQQTLNSISLLNEARKLSSKSEKCLKPIKADVCYGDCIDLSKTYTLETLGTPEPLGRDAREICGDSLSEFMTKKNLSRSMKKLICEDYFWDSMKDNGLARTCAALRGEVDCSKI